MTVGRPVLWLVAGINGAGKTTFYHQRLAPRIAAPYVNADEIARERWPDHPERHAYEAAEIAAGRREVLLTARRSFVTETVFSHRSKLRLIWRAQKAGYRIVFLFVHVANPTVAAGRVGVRVRLGGHDVPEDKVRARFPRTLTNAAIAVRMADESFIYDASSPEHGHRFLLRFDAGRLTHVTDDGPLPDWARRAFRRQLPEGLTDA